MALQLLLGFSSGLPYLLVFSTLSLRLREAGLSLTAIGVFSLVKAPYTFKVFWAPLLDRFNVPVLGGLLGQRRAFAVLFQAGLIVCLCGMGAADPLVNIDMLAFWAIGVALCSASQDVVLDAYRSERLAEGELSAGAAVFVTGYRIALLVAGAGATGLADSVSWSEVYYAMAAIQGVGILAVLFADEPKDQRGTNAPKPQALPLTPLTYLAPFKAFLLQPGAWVIICLALLYKLGDGFLGTLANPFYLDLGFSKTTIAEISKLFGFAATIAGGLIGGALAMRMGHMRALFLGAMLQLISNAGYLVLAHMGADKTVFAAVIFVENFSGGMGTAFYLAAFGLFSRGENTATHFALLTSIMALTRDSLNALSGVVADGLGWEGFFMVSIALSLPSLWIAVKAGDMIERRSHA